MMDKKSCKKYWVSKNCTDTAAEILCNQKYPMNMKLFQSCKDLPRIYAKDIISSLEKLKSLVHEENHE